MIAFRLMGPMARYTGYGVGFRGMVEELRQRQELDFQLRATKGHLPPETEPELLELVAKNGYYDRMGVAVGFADIMDYLVARYSVLYTMYEADDIPNQWKRHVEKANEVWVPTTFCGRVFGKYNRRIRRVRWGVDSKMFRPVKVKKDKSVYTFGAVGVQSPRKGTDVMVKAYNKAFGENESVRLVIKTRDTREMPVIDNKQITVIDTDWPEEKLVEFYNTIDCLLEPSRGDGVAMPPLQAAMCGTPSLVTEWGGPVDYLTEGIYPIRIKGLSKAYNIGADGAKWAEPDERHLAELMQWMVEERPKKIGDISQWTIGNMATEFTEAVKSAWRLYNG